MDITWKRAENYRHMARQGVTCATLRQRHNAGPLCWTLECWKDSELPREKAKSIVKEYLRSEFEAFEISFYVQAGGKPNRFYAMFKSNVL